MNFLAYFKIFYWNKMIVIGPKISFGNFEQQLLEKLFFTTPSNPFIEKICDLHRICNGVIP